MFVCYFAVVVILKKKRQQKKDKGSYDEANIAHLLSSVGPHSRSDERCPVTNSAQRPFGTDNRTKYDREKGKREESKGKREKQCFAVYRTTINQEASFLIDGNYPFLFIYFFVLSLSLRVRSILLLYLIIRRLSRFIRWTALRSFDSIFVLSTSFRSSSFLSSRVSNRSTCSVKAPSPPLRRSSLRANGLQL